MLVPCVVAGCTRTFSTEESISPDVHFLCRDHTPKMRADAAPHFQDIQFDTFHFSRPAVLIDEKNKVTESDPLNPTKRRTEAAPRVQ
jgi:hypothetical protein